MVLCIIEGCDNTGKSSLATYLKVKLQDTVPDGLVPEVHHFGVPDLKNHPLHDLCPLISGYTPKISGPRHLIFDRLHCGESVYGNMYRNGSRLTDAQRWWLDQLYTARGATMVHATANLATVKRRCAANDENYLRQEDVSKCLASYDNECRDLTTWTKFNTSVHSYGSTTYQHLADKIVKVAKMREGLAYLVNDCRTDYVGPLCPSILLVGDRPPSAHPNTPYGAMTPWNGNSAEYLLNAMMDADLIAPGRANDIGMVNARPCPDFPVNLESPYDLWGAHTMLGSPQVIALGDEAAKELDRVKVEWQFKTAHPQYRKRFKHGQREDYGSELADIVEKVRHA